MAQYKPCVFVEFSHFPLDFVLCRTVLHNNFLSLTEEILKKKNEQNLIVVSVRNNLFQSFTIFMLMYNVSYKVSVLSVLRLLRTRTPA